MADLISVFAEAARRHGDRPALIAAEGRVSFAELDRRATAFAARCAGRGVQKGDRILLAMGVGLDLYVALAGAWRVGATVVFPEPALGLGGLRHAIRATRPKFFLASGAYRWLKLTPALWRCPLLTPRASDMGDHAPAPLERDDVALISFTSGSTGAPKAIPRSHGFLLAQRAAVSPLLASDTEEVDLVGFPVFALINLAEGRCSVLPNWKMSKADAVTPEGLRDWIAMTGASRALLPPALCETLAGSDIPPGLHTIFTGGGPVRPALVAALHAQRAEMRIMSVYGSTEAEPIADLDWSEVGPADLEAMASGAGLLAGCPVKDVRLRLVDDEIQVAGDHVNRGYLEPRMDAGNKVHEGGEVWHRTGDAGRLDASGRLWLLGRYSAIAQTPHGRLYPFAVELAAETWSGVDRAALWNAPEGPVLVIDGVADEAVEARAKALGIGRVVVVKALPMDPRHRSKVNYTALAEAVANA